MSRGTAHVLWWDSRNDPFYSAVRPIGNDALGRTAPSLDVYAKAFPAGGAPTSVAATRLTDVRSNPNYEQFGGRTAPFAGDYLWIDSQGGRTFGTWTDWRNTVPGTDQREGAEDEVPGEAADVKQCRTTLPDGSLTSDLCPRAGGLDQNVYGDLAP